MTKPVTCLTEQPLCAYRDSSVLLPAAKHDLIAAQVKIVVCENMAHIAKEARQHGVGELLSGIEGDVVHVGSIVRAGNSQIRIGCVERKKWCLGRKGCDQYQDPRRQHARECQIRVQRERHGTDRTVRCSECPQWCTLNTVD